jgi:hypothetical protein
VDLQKVRHSGCPKAGQNGLPRLDVLNGAQNACLYFISLQPNWESRELVPDGGRILVWESLTLILCISIYVESTKAEGTTLKFALHFVPWRHERPFTVELFY